MSHEPSHKLERRELLTNLGAVAAGIALVNNQFRLVLSCLCRQHRLCVGDDGPTRRRIAFTRSTSSCGLNGLVR